MANFSIVDPPRGLSYAAPLVDFGIIGDLGDTYRRAQDQARQTAVADAFKNQPLPLDPTTGLPDYGKIMQVLASKGGIDAITRLAPAATEQALIGQARQVSPLLGVAPAAATPPGPLPAPQQPIVSQAIPAPAVAPQGGGDQSGSVVDIVTSRLPQDSQATGAVIVNIAKAAGVDPNTALTADQSARVTRMADAYAARTAGRTATDAGPARAAPAGGTTPMATPAQMADARARLTAAMAPSGAAPADRIAAGFDAAGMPALPAAGSRDQGPPGAAPAPAQAAPAAGPVQTQPAPAPTGGRLTPAVPLPADPQTGRQFTDPQAAITALRNEAARLSTNPYAKGQITALTDWATRIENSLSPLKVGQYDTIVSPTGQTLYQGPMARALAGGAGGINAATLDADAERYRQTGTLPPNMGRGVQGQAEAAAIRARAVEHEVAAGGDPEQWASRWQEYRARGVGLSTAERVRASREENLNLILKVTDAAIPAALEQSQKVWRTGFVPLNRIIQGGEVMTSDPDLRAFGMANLQLAEGWARAMNPTGVMRNEDRDKALGFLSTADSPETYRRLVNQLKTQITRERDSIRGGAPMPSPDAPTPPPGGGTSGVVRWERGPDGKLRPAQ